jgi:fanconi-associated nuclease 1
VTTIFALLMWDIMFSDVSGAFETPHQTGPLDLATDTFYRARKEEIECRLVELKDTERTVEILVGRDEQERGQKTWCVGVRWDICEREDLVEIVKVGDTYYHIETLLILPKSVPRWACHCSHLSIAL